MELRRFYVVRSVTQKGIITYNCPTREWALRKLRDAKSAGRQDITVTDPDGRLISEADLGGSVNGSGAAPTEETLLASPQITRQPAMAGSHPLQGGEPPPAR